MAPNQPVVQTVSAFGDSERGRRRKLPRAVREQLILNAADEVVGERGYYLASMEEIAQRAGITKPIVYAYFGSKENLYLAAVTRSGRALLDGLRAAVETPRAKDQLRAAAIAFFSFVIERRDGWAVLRRETGGVPAVAHLLATFRAQIATLLAARVTQAMTDRGGLSRAINAEAVAYAVVGAAEALANYALDHPGASTEQLADDLFAAVWSGLADLPRANR